MIHVNAQGVEIPALGFGTWDLRGETATQMTETALQIGYRHIDTAQAYANELEVGRGLASSGVQRDEIFLTTKIWPDNFRNGDFQKAAAQSVERLGTVPDLLLLHWPNTDVPLEETIDAANDAVTKGLTRHIGVSNFTVAMVEAARARSETPIVTDQVEYHPFLTQQTLLSHFATHKIALTAYCPLARGKVQDHSVLNRIGNSYSKSGGQIALRWLVQQEGVIAIPRSSKEHHARSNFEIFDFALSDAEMNEISALGSPDGRLVSMASHAPAWDRP
ncbi:MAG: aldo/keto reductase [Pseudomonadota bacterium]